MYKRRHYGHYERNTRVWTASTYAQKIPLRRTYLFVLNMSLRVEQNRDIQDWPAKCSQGIESQCDHARIQDKKVNPEGIHLGAYPQSHTTMWLAPLRTLELQRCGLRSRVMSRKSRQHLLCRSPNIETFTDARCLSLAESSAPPWNMFVFCWVVLVFPV